MPLSGEQRCPKAPRPAAYAGSCRLDVRYKNRALFARERGLNYRLVQDIENAARDNFDPPTKLAIERAYGWAYRSINAVLAGGLPSPSAPSSSGFDAATEQKMILGGEELERRRRAQQESQRPAEDEDEGDGDVANGTNG